MTSFSQVQINHFYIITLHFRRHSQKYIIRSAKATLKNNKQLTINKNLRMDNLIRPNFNIGNLSSPNKILQTLKKIQFIMEFFVLSRYSQNSHVIAEFLMAIEAIKFYYKAAHFSQQQNLYMEHSQAVSPAFKEQKSSQTQTQPQTSLQRSTKLLDKIKNKTYRSNDFQPRQYQELSNGKKIQLVTSVQVPQQLKRCKLGFTALLGQILNIIRPFISIIGIRLFGLNSYKSYLLSMAIDLFVMLVLQRNIKVDKMSQMEQMQSRKGQILRRYFFRRPLFMLIKRLVIQPLMKAVIKEDRAIYKIVMSILEMQSSITLTL